MDWKMDKNKDGQMGKRIDGQMDKKTESKDKQEDRKLRHTREQKVKTYKRAES